MLRWIRNDTHFLMASILLATPSVLVAAPTGGIWKSSVNSFGLKQVWCELPMANGATARLMFVCAQDHPESHGVGGLTLKLIVFPVGKFQGFDMGSFEGPDAPAGKRKLMRLRVFGADSKVTLDTRTTLGSLVPVEPRDAWTFFVFADRHARRSPSRRVLDAINAGGRELEITITDPEDAKRAIQVRCPLAGAEEAFRTLLEKP